MNVTVLGKYGPYPKAGGAASGYLLSAGGNRILLDCGSGVFSRLISLCPPEELSAVLLTHLHADHSSDLGVMNYYLQRLGRELDVFLPVDAVRFSAIEGMRGFRFHLVREGERIAVGGAEIAFYGMRHPVPALGIRVSAEGRVFAYTGDTNDFEGLSLFWKGADTVLADAAFLEKDWSAEKPHLSVLRCARYAAAAGARCLLTHINPAYSEEEIRKEASAYSQAEIAEEGRTYEV